MIYNIYGADVARPKFFIFLGQICKYPKVGQYTNLRIICDINKIIFNSQYAIELETNTDN